MIRLKLGLLLLTISPVFAELPKPIVVNAVSDRYRPLALDQQKLTGLLASRIRANSEGYLEHVSANSQSSAESFRGLSGAFLDAAANAYEYRRHEQLKVVMDRVAKQLLATLASEEASEVSVTAPIQRYDLLGLIAYYRITGDASVFSASKKIGNQLVKAAASRSEDFEPGFALEPIVQLYRYTGDERYLTSSRSIAAVLKQPGSSERARPYEKLVSLLGLLELYRVTGDESYFRVVLSGWAAAHAEVSLTGTLLASTKDSELADPCITAAWMQLTLDLLRITGDPRYAQQLERTMYNQLFAGQNSKTGALFSTIQFNGTKKAAAGTDECAPNEARAISIIPSAVWGRWGNGIAVMLYTGGRATFQLRRRATVQLYSEATYPETGEISLHVEPSHTVRFPLRLRVPDWADRFIVDIGESHLIGDPGEFIILNREWKRGDTVKISMEMPVHVIDGSPVYADQVAIQRGPQLLAIGKTLNPEIEDLAAARLISTDPRQLKLTAQGNGPAGNWAGDQAYAIAGEYRSTPRQLILVPFADAIAYRVWISKPNASSGAN